MINTPKSKIKKAFPLQQHEKIKCLSINLISRGFAYLKIKTLLKVREYLRKMKRHPTFMDQKG